MNMNIHEEFLKILDKALQKYGSANKLAKILNVAPNKITRWKNRERVPNLSSIQALVDITGAKLSLNDEEASKDVCFVDAELVPASENAIPPKSEDYIAAPLVGEVGAGPGYLPEDEVKSWFLVYKRLPAIRYRKNLIAVELGPTSTSMQPTFNPKDIVLVDRDDRDVDKPGRIMLVRDPVDGSGMIKRVHAQDLEDDCRITFYSDNAAKWPPMMYSLKNDFDGDWDKAIVGRVIWAWQDVRDK